ncbi:GNAT family N-acetyltransferase [Streptomyces sp. NPDC057908]|uniref:GNAT family N-acetyltransferase n=1 Tax=Streptomyces sp. NPDC057908 TaxID=3346276 RepID=UPI0036F18CC9
MTNHPAEPPRSPHTNLAPVSYEHADARRLMRALQREQTGIYGFADDPTDTPPADFDPPHGLFVIAHHDGIAVGCGGVRLLDADTAEIKRMYVAETARGRGLGRRILEHLEQRAFDSGATQIVLETGWRNYGALTLYRQAGYGSRPSYVPGRDLSVNRAMGKRLDVPDQASARFLQR